jgi:hypothetical protein
MSGAVLDAVPEAEAQSTKEYANHSAHVSDQENSLVSGILKTVVDVDNAHKVLDGLLDPTEPVVIELKLHVTASQDSMRSLGNVLDAQLDKEVQLTKLDVNH